MVLLKQLIQRFRDQSLTVATAESCTGGMLAAMLTECPGSSSWFDRGFITYSNLAKQEMLGVPMALIEQYGAVSEAVALEMAHGALRNSEAVLSLSITGIAGPSGGSVEKPVGMVCFALDSHFSKPVVVTQHFMADDRSAIRQAACEYALKMMLTYGT